MCGGGTVYGSIGKSQSFGELMPQDWASQCYPIRRDRMCREGWMWVFPFLQVGEALIKPQEARL